VIRSVCLLVCLSIFHEVWHRCLISLPNFAVNFSEVKVKVEGQNCRTENLALVLVIAWP